MRFIPFAVCCCRFFIFIFVSLKNAFRDLSNVINLPCAIRMHECMHSGFSNWFRLIYTHQTKRSFWFSCFFVDKILYVPFPDFWARLCWFSLLRSVFGKCFVIRSRILCISCIFYALSELDFVLAEWFLSINMSILLCFFFPFDRKQKRWEFTREILKMCTHTHQMSFWTRGAEKHWSACLKSVHFFKWKKRVFSSDYDIGYDITACRLMRANWRMKALKHTKRENDLLNSNFVGNTEHEKKSNATTTTEQPQQQQICNIHSNFSFFYWNLRFN